MLHEAGVRPARRSDKNSSTHVFKEIAASVNANAIMIGTFFHCAQFVSNYFRPAGWSSLVARQAHNLKVAGSNPAPATNFSKPRWFIAFTSSEIDRASFTSVYRTIRCAESINIMPASPNGLGGKGPWSLVSQSEEMSLSDARKLEILLKRQKGGDGFYKITGLSRSGS